MAQFLPFHRCVLNLAVMAERALENLRHGVFEKSQRQK
jgi:hypothetical protein